MTEKCKALAIGGPLDGKMVEFEGLYFRAYQPVRGGPVAAQTMFDTGQCEVSAGWWQYKVEVFRVGDRVDYFGIYETGSAAEIIQALIDAYMKSR